uniref:Uncharacterized protein n=1 Tax=Tolypothrix bouteillei VB521301 TaxID=1479485 RepID=A0A0C1NHP7_9CYAN
MSCYISSKENRFYVSGENSLGVAAVPTAEGGITAVKLEAREETSTAERRDKTGSRTYVGVPNTVN